MELRRRQWIAAAACTAAGLARAQPARLRRIGVLALESTGSVSFGRQQEILRDALRTAGLAEGERAIIDWRMAEGRVERLEPLAHELVRGGAEVIIAFYSAAVVAASRVTSTTPIIAMGVLDPVALGVAQSLARPGGNVTGTVFAGQGMLGKMFEVVREAVPRARRIAVLINTRVPRSEQWDAEYEAIAKQLGLVMERFPALSPDEVMPAARRAAASRPDALFIVGDSVINPSVGAIAALAIENRLPLVGTTPGHVREGALLAYTIDIRTMIERTATYAARVLSGAKPGDLAMEAPTHYELVINTKTAAALRWEVPPALRARVDRFIE
jgi:putative ABC transport system substrate-binding protein